MILILVVIAILLFCLMGSIRRASLTRKEAFQEDVFKLVLLGILVLPVGFAVLFYGGDTKPVAQPAAETVQAHAFPFPARKP